MATVGIMHSGSQAANQYNITALQQSLETAYGQKPAYSGPLWANGDSTKLAGLAQQLLGVDLLIAAGGSLSAEAARDERAKTNPNKPVIVFTSVAPYVVNNLPAKMTGVNAHTSDHDVARLQFLVQLLVQIGFHGQRIGVLRNSNRGDQNKQMGDLNQAVHDINQKTGSNWVLRPRDIKTDHKITESFKWLKGDIHALLVAADPFFNNSRGDVVDGAKAENYPTIYQWREFVDAGGLISYGPNLTKMYQRAGTMAGNILKSNLATIPPVWAPQESDFELVVSQAAANKIPHMWPLPPVAANAVVLP
jgi:putative tryptophan/tyrosine transport system substrate-binding protein